MATYVNIKELRAILVMVSLKTVRQSTKNRGSRWRGCCDCSSGNFVLPSEPLINQTLFPELLMAEINKEVRKHQSVYHSSEKENAKLPHVFSCFFLLSPSSSSSSHHRDGLSD